MQRTAHGLCVEMKETGRGLIATVRPREVLAAEVTVHSLAEAYKAFEAERPDGFDLVQAGVRMSNGTTELSAVGRFARRDGLTEIKAADISALRTAVPEGSILLNVRAR
ncbi:hypothetical protein [Microbacterium sp. NPDC089188]|uniref:hypothetical protein n=1 Tax=Microbacterium sp. NPDC089188 TaxID=3154971 RepID=UPI003417049E